MSTHDAIWNVEPGNRVAVWIVGEVTDGARVLPVDATEGAEPLTVPNADLERITTESTFPAYHARYLRAVGEEAARTQWEDGILLGAALDVAFGMVPVPVGIDGMRLPSDTERATARRHAAAAYERRMQQRADIQTRNERDSA